MSASLKKLGCEELNDLSVSELKSLWREHSGRKGRLSEAPTVRALLVRDLAWMIQQKQLGGLDQETQRLLNAAVRQAETKRKKSPGAAKQQKQSRRTKKAQLQSGVTLVRKWRGKTYKVKVVEDANGKRAFRFASREYRSLTIIAKEITGAHWSGPRFFGLNRVRSTG